MDTKYNAHLQLFITDVMCVYPTHLPTPHLRGGGTCTVYIHSNGVNPQEPHSGVNPIPQGSLGSHTPGGVLEVEILLAIASAHMLINNGYYICAGDTQNSF